MPGPLSAENLTKYADPAYLSRSAPAQSSGPNYMHRIGLPVLLGSETADELTTLAALQRGAKEGNPLYGSHPSAWRVVGQGLATALPLALVADQLYDKSQPGSKTRKLAMLL